MRNILLIAILSVTPLSVFAEGIKDVIAGKSFEHTGRDYSVRINSFDKDCKTVTTYVDGRKTETNSVTCGKTAEYSSGGKKVTFLMEGSKVRKDVDAGNKEFSFDLKEVPNPE